MPLIHTTFDMDGRRGGGGASAVVWVSDAGLPDIFCAWSQIASTRGHMGPNQRLLERAKVVKVGPVSSVPVLVVGGGQVRLD